LFFHLIPLFASLMAVAFLGETFRWFHGAGMGLIFVGIWLANKGRPERPRRDRT
jgi:drug/metabolite transporter (DMT)-like permease